MNKYDLQQYQIALQFLKGIGPIKARKLLNSTELLSDIFETDYNSLARNTGLPKASLVQMQREEALQMAKEHLKNIHYLGLQTHFITDSSYPRRLKNCEDAPLLLFSDGEMNLNSSRMLAVVGTRNATNYGRKICDELIEHIAGEDIVVVSGMAYGIDIYMHQLCVRHDIPTIGVLGHGLDQ